MQAADTWKCQSSKMVTLDGLNSQLLHQLAMKSRPQGFTGLDVPADKIPAPSRGLMPGPEPKQHTTCVDEYGTNHFFHGNLPDRAMPPAMQRRLGDGAAREDSDLPVIFRLADIG